jgi:hypothetical protein
MTVRIQGYQVEDSQHRPRRPQDQYSDQPASEISCHKTLDAQQSKVRDPEKGIVQNIYLRMVVHSGQDPRLSGQGDSV